MAFACFCCALVSKNRSDAKKKSTKSAFRVYLLSKATLESLNVYLCVHVTGHTRTRRFTGATRPSRTQRLRGTEQAATKHHIAVEILNFMLKMELLNFMVTVFRCCSSGSSRSSRSSRTKGEFKHWRVWRETDFLIRQDDDTFAPCESSLIFLKQRAFGWSFDISLLSPPGKHGTELPRTQRREGIYCLPVKHLLSSPFARFIWNP